MTDSYKQGKRTQQSKEESSESDDQGMKRKRSRSRSRDKQQNKMQSMQSKPKHEAHKKHDRLEEKQSKSKESAQLAKPLHIDVNQEITEDLLKSVLGFSGFGTSKGKDHSSSSVECVQKLSQVRRKYRQYMNRRGGFNRNLDEMKD